MGVGTSAAQDVKPKESKARTQSAQDVRKMQALAKDVRATLEKSKHNVLSLSTLKSLDEIGTLSRTVRGRLKGK